MFTDFTEPAPQPCPEPDADALLLLWSLRRMAVAWPRCHAVHIALQQAYGEDGLGVEHMVRCWLERLTLRATRRLVIGEPGCALLLRDEAALLLALRTAGDGSGRAAATLVALTGEASAGDLEPMLATLRDLARVQPRGRSRR